MTTKAKIYDRTILREKLKLSYNVDYETFNELKTCGLKEKSAWIKGTKIDPYLSTWLLEGEKLKILLEDPKEEDFYKLREKLCSNLVLLGLNAGSMDKMTPAWHFFHHRYKNGTDKLIETSSEKYLKEYITKYRLPFEGAYITDILKFQDTENNLYIEPDSSKVNTNSENIEVQNYNFEFLKNELNLLHKMNPENSQILIVAMGAKTHDCLQRFLVWLPEEDREKLCVPESFMAHYSSAGWNSEKSKAKVVEMQRWCEEHIIL